MISDCSPTRRLNYVGFEGCCWLRTWKINESCSKSVENGLINRCGADFSRIKILK